MKRKIELKNIQQDPDKLTFNFKFTLSQGNRKGG